MDMSYSKSGQMYFPQTSGDSLKKLPPKTFLIQRGMTGLFLVEVPDIELPPKLYGNVDNDTNRIINSFFDRKKNTGVLLQGEKGSGKTLLSKVLSNKLMKENIPTILINDAITGEDFNKFMADITQPVVIIFDEFEKKYSQASQESMLTIFDGVFSSNKLFVVAVNDDFRLIPHFKNRPGRFFYRIEYKGLDKKFVEDYCEDKLINKEHLSSVVTYSQIFRNFNFDMLQAIIEEMNRYDEPLLEAVRLLNTSPVEENCKYVIAHFENKREDIIIRKFEKEINDGIPSNPFFNKFFLRYEKEKDKKEDEEDFFDEDGFVNFCPKDFKSGKDGKFTFENKEGLIVIEKEVLQQRISIERMLIG